MLNIFTLALLIILFLCIWVLCPHDIPNFEMMIQLICLGTMVDVICYHWHPNLLHGWCHMCCASIGKYCRERRQLRNCMFLMLIPVDSFFGWFVQVYIVQHGWYFGMFPILLHLSCIQAQQGLFQCQDLVNHAAGHQVAAGDPSLLLDTVITECVQGGGSV